MILVPKIVQWRLPRYCWTCFKLVLVSSDFDSSYDLEAYAIPPLIPIIQKPVPWGQMKLKTYILSQAHQTRLLWWDASPPPWNRGEFSSQTAAPFWQLFCVRCLSSVHRGIAACFIIRTAYFAGGPANINSEIGLIDALMTYCRSLLVDIKTLRHVRFRVLLSANVDSRSNHRTSFVVLMCSKFLRWWHSRKQTEEGILRFSILQPKEINKTIFR